MHICDLTPTMVAAIEQAARLLTLGFAEHWSGSWSTHAEALEEVHEMLAPERFVRLAMEGDVVAGWIGGIPQYDGNVWELHPLVVDPAWQRQGIGRRLVEDFEQQVKGRGGLTIWLGSDDVDGMTSLAGADLYVEPWQQIRDIRNLQGHPYEFYQKMGFTILGVLPDANGPGKPDILMGKRVT